MEGQDDSAIPATRNRPYVKFRTSFACLLVISPVMIPESRKRHEKIDVGRILRSLRGDCARSAFSKDSSSSFLRTFLPNHRLIRL